MTSMLVSRFYLAQLFVLDSNFYAKGLSLTPNAVTPGTTLNSYVVPAPVKYTPANPTYEAVYSYAGEALRGRREAGITDYGNAQLTLSEYDETVNQMSGGALTDATTASAHSLSSPNANQKNPPRLGAIFSAGATPVNSAESFLNIMIVNFTLRRPRPGANQGNGKNPDPLSLDIVLSTGTRTPLGLLFSATALAVSKNSDTELYDYFPAPLLLTSYVDNGTSTSVTFPYTPYSTTVDGTINIVTKNGVDAHSGMSGITGKVATITPGSSGDIWQFGIPVALQNVTNSG